MTRACRQCVRVRPAVPEAVHQLARMPGLQVLGRDAGALQVLADPETIDQLRANRLVKDVSPVRAPAAPAERLEPWATTIFNGLLELLHQPGVQLVVLAVALRAAFGSRRS